jgi:hypothetical protein
MTAVYSGGLVYEYSEEGSKYGLVTISGGKVTEGADFTALMTAFKGTANPTGDGGYNATGGASNCPAKSATWNVSSNALPAIPSGAANLMKTGAGKGAGLTGLGSQNAGGTSTGTATPGSGSVTATNSASTSKSAAVSFNGPVDKAPMVISAIVLAFTCLGATLL